MDTKNSMLLANMMSQKPKIMYATIKGTLTENDGVFSGFSSSNYLQLQQNLDTSKPFEIVVKFTTDTLSLNNSILYESSYGFFIRMKYLSGRKIYIDLSHSTDKDVADNVGGQIALQNDTTYWLKFSFDLSKYVVSLSTDGINYTEDIVVNSTLTLKNSGYIDIGSREETSTYVQGTIDLNNSYIKLGSTKYNLQAVVGYTVVGSPTITDGVVSGFSSNDYLIIESSFSSDDYDVIEFNTKITTENSIADGLIIGIITYYVVGLAIINSKLTCRTNFGSYSNAISDITLQANTTYTIKGIIDKRNSTISINVNGTINSASFAYETARTLSYRIGQNNGIGAFNGSIYLNSTNIKRNNKLWFNGQQA